MSCYKGYKSILKTEATATLVAKTLVTVKETKTIKMWEQHFDTLVLDPDGFPNHTDRNSTLFTEEEFLQYVKSSTVKISDKLRKALDTQSK